MIVLFTDFGVMGPYVGQMKVVLYSRVRGVAVVDLMHDAPTHDPRASAYLLGALIGEVPAGAICLCVVDPGVGGVRRPLALQLNGRWLVGPDNGLFELALREGGPAATWRIAWKPERLSSTFHGRDLFAPVAASLAAGLDPAACGLEPAAPTRFPDWPEDWPAILYIDHFGNCMTGIKAAELSPGRTLLAGGQALPGARTYADVA
ncbi:MAG: SAM-dependent chlorinase/fluorinase, partial [Rhodospirillales bacterium]|nr:SAM-dependent chlorinase/fluorinase [Rhodospirillales bacterium]